MVRRFQVIFIILCALSVSACDRGARKGGDEKPIVLGYSQLGDESTWRTRNSLSITEAAKKAGIKIMFEDAMQDQANQIKALRSFIAYKVDVIAFSPLVETGWDTVLREAKAAGIPVILVDRMIDTEDESLYACALCSDFTLEGRKAGEFLLKKYKSAKGPINIVEIAGTEKSTPAIGRYQGFREVISAYPKFKVIFSEDGDFMASKGRELMQQILARYDPKDIDVLYSHNDDMTFGAIEVMREAGIKPGKDIAIISVDATQRSINYLKVGLINCVIECNPNSGNQVMELTRKVVAGERVPKRTYIDETRFDEFGAVDEIPNRGY
ncbi:MAG TPA: ABC transporter substrate-binding protein [Treponemataceae bacterium]|nr:ABC transporter substrate-binding protein [Treponemataceae bacterium]